MSALLAPFARVKTVERKVLLLLALLVAVMGIYQIVRVQVSKSVQINGPIYEEIEQEGDLYADVINPRLYVDESYLAVREMIEAATYGEWSDVARLIEEHRVLAREHRQRAAYWRNQKAGEDIRDALEQTLVTADALLTLIDDNVVPALRRRDVAGARAAFKSEGVQRFAAHRRAAETLRREIAVASDRTEQRVERLAGQLGTGLDVGAVLVLALFTWILLVGMRQLVLTPVQRARRHFERIGGGDWSTPVRTRREDEFGDLLRDLERMRVKLAAAVAARESSEAACLAAEHRYRDIVERSIQGFYQSTADGRFLAANPKLASMLGYESVEALLAEPTGTADRMYVDPAQRAEFVRLITAQGYVSGFEAALRRRDGRVIWITEHARVVPGEGDTPGYREGFIDDVTVRKEAEQLKSDFVSFVTHQLRTPLAGIRWMLELAQQENLEGEAASCVEDARLSAERLITLVNDLLNIARLENGRVLSAAEPTDIDRVAADVVRELSPLAVSKTQTITVEAEQVPRVLVDPQLARQAVLNFLSNAIKFTPAGGTIHLRTVRDGHEVHWSVRDTGIGVPPGAQERIFEKFYRAENAQVIDTEGTGLGLYLARLIAQRAGGTVRCESVEGEGSTFTLTLPVAEERKAVA